MNLQSQTRAERLSPAVESGGGAPSKRRGKKRIVLIGLGGIMVVIALLAVLAPTIASSVAPGKIEAAAKESIRGSVKVGAIHLGWFSPTEVEGLSIVDPEGKTCATVSVKSAATLWRVVSERWWSAKNLNVGETELSGTLDLVRDEATGVTNLQRALEPRVAAGGGGAAKSSGPESGGGGGGGLESVKGSLKITKLDATVKDRDAKGVVGPEQGVKGLKGLVTVDYAASPASIAAKADLTGTPVGPGAEGAMTVKADVGVKPRSGGKSGLESFACNLDVAGAPVGIIDALARQGGAMTSALGARADVRVDASGTPAQAHSHIVLASAGANANLMLSLKDGVVTSEKTAAATANPGSESGSITVKSTEFLASMPALREALARAGAQVKLDKAPGLEITIEKLKWPLPQGLLDGSAGSAAMAAADFRGSGMVLKVHVDAMGGTVAMNAPAAGATQEWKSFAVQPVDLTVQAEDLSKPLSVTGGTRATLDGSAAGDLSLTATASGLLDAAGKLRALNKNGIADDVNAEVRVSGMSTALLQPFVAGSGLAVDLRQDVGPTLNLAVRAKADVKGVDASKQGQTPPVDATISVDSSNVKVDGAVRYAGGVVSTTGDGLKVTMGTTMPLVQRMMAKPGAAPALELSGTGALAVTVKDFAAPMDKLSGVDALAAVKAAITAEVSSLGVRPAQAATESRGTQSEQPVQIGTATVNVRLDGANPPRADVAASMSHAGSPFDVAGQFTLDGITGGKLPSGAKGAAQVIAFKPTGTLELRNVPRSVANLVPSASIVGTGTLAGDDAMTQISRALRESIGATATVAMTTKPDGGAQAMTVKVTTANGGLGADVAAKLTDKDVTVSTLSAAVGMDPKTVNPVLASSAAKNPARSGGVPMALAKAFTVSVKSGGAITVPLKSGTFEPDFAGASDANISLATDNDIAIDNVPIGEDAGGVPKTTGVRVSGLKMDVKAPLSGLAAGGASKRLNATFSALAQRSGGDKAATIADVSGTVTAGMDGSTPEANVKLGSIDTAVVENLIGKPGVLTGGLGNTAEATLRVQPQSGGQAISMALTAPRVRDAKIDLFQTAEKLSITKPALITWTPDAAFLNRTLFSPPTTTAQATPAPTGGAGGSGLGGAIRKLTGEPAAPAAPVAAAGVSVTSVSSVTISISKFAMATSVTRDGQVVSGPLKPGVFELEASVGVPTVGLTVTGGQAAPMVIGMEGLKANVTHAGASGAFGELVAVLGIDKVTGGAGTDATRSVAVPNAKKTGATVRVANLADARGVLTTNAAVVNLDADLVSFPTVVIDSLAHQKGVLAELLGPTVDVQAKGTNVSMGGGDMTKASGAVQVKMQSPRASAEINGDIKDGAFVQSGPINARIMAISPELVKMLAGALPVVETIEKKPGDQPGAGDATGFMVPVDGDVTKLNGDLTIDPGVAKFTTKSIFGDFIKAFGGKTEGTLGQRIEPFKVHADHGVLTYDKFALPAGQFKVETRGTVDLVRRQIDVVTYAPAGALTEKALGKIMEQVPSQLRGLLQEASIPFVTKGPLDSYSTSPDFGLLVKELGEKVKKEPGKIIGDVLGDLLKPKPKGK